MKLFAKSIIAGMVLTLCLSTTYAAEEKMKLSIDGLTISELVKLVSATTKKNIFMSEEVAGTINYSGNKPIGRKDLYRLLQTTLETKGYTLVDTGGGFLNVVKIADASSMNLPFMEKSDIPQMQTQIYNFKYSTADNMGNKVKHFVSKNGKVTFSKDSNSIIVTDFPDVLATIKKAMKVMDVKDESTANSTYVIGLKNADSKLMTATLNSIIGKMTLIPGQQPPSIASDDATNSIIVVASETLYKSLESTIKSLDSDRQQVYVRARIIEISEQKSQEVGIKYGVSGGKVGNNGLFTFNSSLGDGSTGAVSLAPALLSMISLPTFTSGIALGVNIALLNTNGAANVLSEPSILCVDNQESSIYVGKTVSISSGTTVAGTGLSQENFTRQDIGLTLKIKPRLSNDNKVLLGVTTKLEDIEPSLVRTTQPTTTKREVLTSAIVSNGESVIIGGLIREKHDETSSKVPFLGDIPVLEYLFSSKGISTDRINLVIILTPYIIGKSENLTTLRSQLNELDAIEQKYVNTITNKLEAKAQAQ